MSFLDQFEYDTESSSSAVRTLASRLQRIEARKAGGYEDEHKWTDWMEAAITIVISGLDADADGDMDAASARARRIIADHWDKGIPLFELGLFPLPDEPQRGILTGEVFDALAQEAVEVAKRAVAAAEAKARIPALAADLWKVLRMAPYEAFGDEPWDALRAGQSAACTAMWGVNLAADPLAEPHEHTEVFPLLAVALGALHEAADADTGITETYDDWAFREND